MSKYNHKKVDKKWQNKWTKEGIYSPELAKTQNKFYNLWMFPYPSAQGVHVGTIFSSTGSDVFGRYKGMNGYQVFQPMGMDSFGIHSENYALKKKENPKKLVPKVINNYERQFHEIGHRYDWSRKVITSEPDYYRWTQWLFTEMFKAGLAYRKEAPVNWCPSCKTVLADEQVVTPKQAGKEPKHIDGSVVTDPENAQICERCGYVVEIRNLAQWFFRITDYADRLLDNLDKIDWSERVIKAQRNWIGKKQGINITYRINGIDKKIVCWTSRPDTNFGATFIVVSPEYAKENLAKLIPSKHRNEVNNYIKKALEISAQDRIKEGRKKTGVNTGLFAINGLNKTEMPIWIADFVLSGVGTGAVVGVPGHDKRDFEFAKEFDLPIRRVVAAPDGDESEITNIEQVQEDDGTMINSEFLNGLDIHEATEKIMDHLEDVGQGERVINYHLRDWLISRQRYWGPPIPMIYCESCAKNGDSWFTLQDRVLQERKLHKDQSDWDHLGWWPIDDSDLPVELPNIKNYKPKGTGRGPLNDHPEFYKVECPHCGSDAKRETDVSDTFLDSSWYFLRYPSVDAKSKDELPFDPTVTENWLPVDLYFGGAEHSVLHLMYARFVTMMLHDLGHIKFDEPFPKFFAHGLMIKDGAKMSKSRGNVVNPDKYIEKFGADTLRLYLMFMGPMDGYPDFRDTGIEGMHRFTNRVWEVCNVKTGKVKDKDLLTKMHQTIKKVTEDIENYRYNTAISAIMEYVNALRAQETSNKSQVTNNYLKTLVLLLAPFAPHMTEEIWRTQLKQSGSIHIAKWPKYDLKLIVTDTVTIPVQVNGKLRSQIEVDSNIAEDKLKVLTLAKRDQRVSKWLKGKKIKKEIFVPGKLVNFVL